MARIAVDPPLSWADFENDLGRRCPLPGTPDGQEGRPLPKAGRSSMSLEPPRRLSWQGMGSSFSLWRLARRPPVTSGCATIDSGLQSTPRTLVEASTAGPGVRSVKRVYLSARIRIGYVVKTYYNLFVRTEVFLLIRYASSTREHLYKCIKAAGACRFCGERFVRQHEIVRRRVSRKHSPAFFPKLIRSEFVPGTTSPRRGGSPSKTTFCRRLNLSELLVTSASPH